MLAIIIILSIVSVCLLLALIFAVAKGIKYYAKSIKYEKEIGVCHLELARSEREVRTDKAQRDLLVELTDSIQVLISDITDESESNDAAIANFKKDIDRICSKTPVLYWKEKDLTPSKYVEEQACERDEYRNNCENASKNSFSFALVCITLAIFISLISILLNLIR